MPTPTKATLTVIVQQQLCSREQLGPVLWVHDVQLIEVCFPQLFEVFQCLIAIEQQGGCVFLVGRGRPSAVSFISHPCLEPFLCT